MLTLNLLRGSCINPRLSAKAQLHSAFDFNQTPLGPLGTRVLIHETADVHQSYAPHGVSGYYIGAAENHYRSIQQTSPTKQNATLIPSVGFRLTPTPMPQTFSIDAAQAAATNLIEALQKPTPATPFAGIDTTSLAALRELATVFRTSVRPPATEPDPESTPPVVPASAPRVTKKLLLHVNCFPGKCCWIVCFPQKIQD
jgi:hypothetical protein